MKRSSSLSRQYKSAAQDDVPTELDQKILLQARESLKDKNESKVVTHPSWWTKWNKPLALAATLLLAVTVIYRVGDQSIDKLAVPEATMALKEKEDTAIKTESLNQNSAGLEKNSLSAKTATAAGRAEIKQNEPMLTSPRNIPLPAKEQSPPVAVPQVSFAAPAAAPVAPAINQEVEKDKEATSGALAKLSEKPVQDKVPDPITKADAGTLPDASMTESIDRIPSVTLAKRERSIANAEEKRASDAEELLRHIRELRKQGKDKEATKAWKQFRKSFPDYPVAEDDVARMN